MTFSHLRIYCFLLNVSKFGHAHVILDAIRYHSKNTETFIVLVICHKILLSWYYTVVTKNISSIAAVIMGHRYCYFNPYHAEFHKWNNPPSIFGIVHYHFRDIKMKTESWSPNSIEPGQTAWMWRLTSGSILVAEASITFGVGRIRVNIQL